MGEDETDALAFLWVPAFAGMTGGFTPPTGGEGTRPVGALGTHAGLQYLIQEELRAFFLGVVEDLVGCA